MSHIAVVGYPELSAEDQEWIERVRASHDGRSDGMYECQPSKDWVDSFDPGSSPCTQRVDVDTLPVLAGTQPGLAAGG